MKTKGVVTQYNKLCFFCGKPTATEHHLLFGRGIKPLAEEDGIKAPCCGDCHLTGKLIERIHDNIAAEKLSKIAGQLAWEKEFYRAYYDGLEDLAREEFMKRYRRSYL